MNSEKQLKLLESYILRLNKTQIGHFIAFEKFSRIDRYLGFTIVIFSGITTGLLLFDFNVTNNSNLKIIIIISSLLMSIATAIQTFLNYKEKASTHKSTASRFGSLKRSIEVSIANNNQDFESFLKSIETQWSIIADDSPVTPLEIRKKSINIIKDDATEENEILNQ